MLDIRIQLQAHKPLMQELQYNQIALSSIIYRRILPIEILLSNEKQLVEGPKSSAEPDLIPETLK